MPKKTTTFERMLPARDAATPAYRWLYEALRVEILQGRLRPGARLPGTRDLARQHGLSRGTIVAAFDQLAAEGYVEGSVGSGTYVSSVLPDELLHVGRSTRSTDAPARAPKRHLSGYARRVQLFPGYEDRPTRAFRANLPALDLFPMTLWTQLAARRLRRASVPLLRGCDPLGYTPLREAIADYLTSSRGVRCTADEVAIVGGAQEALDLAARLFLERGDRVWMEDPGYPGASIAFEAAGAKITTTLRGARLLYLTPAHQFPSGTTMPLARRLELLEWARTNGALIFEDDYDSEYRYEGRPVPALQGLDRHGVVLFAGTFSKVLFPSLRLGYLVAPPDLMPHIAAAISVTTRHAPLLEQAVLCDFITGGHFARHLRRMREIYAERLGVLIDSARERLAGFLEISEVQAGLQTVGWLRDGIDGESAAIAAAAHNVEVTPLSRYTRGRVGREGLQLGFAAIDAREIRRGVRELAMAFGV
ncbi:MAG TPA: PLP-dependent aminotransferase family protein [Thermoanaerobaculia bacterium]|nr:PLP-dependent aminotransferase family protein [Thermoanaerobaculia bacterium]